MNRFVLAVSVVVLVCLPANAETKLSMKPQWPGVYLIWYDDLNVKSVVAEFDSFLAVVEVPHDDQTARGLLAFLREKFPTKPLRFAFHTHHHSHSIGAIDPLVAAGVTIVTTPANLDEIRALSGDPSSVGDRVLTIRDTFELADHSNVLRAHVIHKDRFEIPTDEYVVVEFPKVEALVSGCLFSKPLTYWEVVNTRKTSLAAFLADRKLGVRWLIPTNSTHASGFEDVCTREMLAESLEKGLQPSEVADRLQARSIDDLRAGIDALSKEFAAKTPRSFDILVCGNYLKSKRSDYARASVLFEVAARLFPREVEPWWFLGEAQSLAGDKAKAREAWLKALELATTDDDKREIQAALSGL